MKYFPVTEVKHTPLFEWQQAWFDSMQNCKTVSWDSETSYARWMREYGEGPDDINMHQVNGVWMRK